MLATLSEAPAATVARYRSGTAARLAGLPVTTLRVWERRYGVVAALKTPTGQRLYSPHDVARLRLLRQLTRDGHPIGTIASLGLEPLQALADSGGRAPGTAGSAVPPISGTRHSAVVVGPGIGHKLEPLGCWSLHALYDDLEQAEAAVAGNDQAGFKVNSAEMDDSASGHALAAVDVLVVRVPSLQPGHTGRIVQLAERMNAHAIVVLYAFGSESTAQALRAAGAAVRREPITRPDLAQLMRAMADRVATDHCVEAGARGAFTRHDSAWQPPLQGVVAPRQFSDEALARLIDLPSKVGCECSRHVSEIVMQLAAFEQYSRDCLSGTPADAALHRHLTQIAGSARTAFERALVRVVEDDDRIVAVAEG